MYLSIHTYILSSNAQSTLTYRQGDGGDIIIINRRRWRRYRNDASTPNLPTNIIPTNIA